MGDVAVRVMPRSSRRVVGVEAESIVIRVRSAPERGKATEEARRALADALGVPASAVSLRSGRRSRTKVFQVEGVGTSEALMLLRRS